MATVTERLQLLITASAKGAANEIKSVGAATGDATAKTSIFQKGLSKVGLEGASTGTIMKTALAGGIAVGGAALAKFAADGVEQFSNLTGQVRAFQRVSGESAETSSKLVFATRELGIAPDVAAASVGRLETKLGTGKAHLEQFGIATKNAKGETLDAATILANVAEAYQNADSQSEKAAIGNEAFGKSWQKMAPLLGKSREELQALYAEAGKDHQIFSQQDLENGRKLALATTQLKDAFTGLEVEIGSALAPAVTSGTNALTDTIHTADDATSALGGLGGATRILTDNVNILGAAQQGSSAVGDLFAGHFADAGKNALGAIPGVRGFTNALFGEDEATNTLGDTQQRAKDAALNLANAQAEHGKNSREAKDAEDELTSATRELDGMQKNLDASLQNVNSELTTHAQKLYDAAIAAQTASADHLSYDNAVANVTKGLYDLTAAQADGSTSAFDLAQKQRDLAAQVLAVQQAAEKQAVDTLPKSATQQDRFNAASQAGARALQDLYNQFPGLRDQVVGYTGDVYSVPGERGTTMYFDAGQAYADLVAFRQALDTIPRYIEVGVKLVGDAITNNDLFKP